MHILKKKNPEIIKNFIDGKLKEIKCPKHGLHKKWWLNNKINLNLRLRCLKCNLDYEAFLRKKNVLYFLIKYGKKNAKNSNKKFTITLDDLKEKIKIQENKCAYTKISFDNEKNKPSMDRINSKLGYTKENIQLVLWNVNKMKSDFDHDLFLKICNLIIYPVKNTGSLKLLKYTLRKKLLSEQQEDKRKFLSGEKVLCYRHGFHRKWKIYKHRTMGQTIEKIYCTFCGIPHNKQITTSKEREERAKRFKNKQKIYCKIHGYHLNYKETLGSVKTPNVQCINCRTENRQKKIFAYILSAAKYNAKQAKIEFNLQYYNLIEQYIEQKGKCKYTGIILDEKINKPSIDRINSNKGYTKNNICLTTFTVNRIKSDFTINDLKKYAYLIVKNN